MNLPRRPNRRAMLVLSMLACMTLVMLLMAGWLKFLALERQQLRGQQNRIQAEYLANSAMSRAMARLAADTAYEGETLNIDAASLGAAAPATLSIRVEKAGDDGRARLVTVSAQVPATGADRALRSKQKRILLAPEEPTP